jgi:hypothetical protein
MRIRSRGLRVLEPVAPVVKAHRAAIMRKASDAHALGDEIRIESDLQ